MNKLRIIIHEKHSAAENLAIDEAILELLNVGKGPETFRLWINSEAAIAPFHESIFDLIDVKFCFDNKIELNRRITGGGAIYHDKGNLNWSFYLKREPYEKLSLTEIYKFFSQIILKVLNRIGIKAEFHEPNWIGIEGRKISGMAGYIKRNAMLIHGTLLVNANLFNLKRVCKLHFKYPEVMNLKEIRLISLDEVIDAMEETIRKYSKELTKGDLIDEEIELAKKLFQEKYTDLSWIFLK